jgi:hypothetical protein
MKAGFLYGLVLALACGCSGNPSGDEAAWVPGARQAFYRAEAVDNAVIREQTIYPHHFVEGRAELNELGRRAVNVLAEHYRGQEGTLNVRRGDAAQQLYAARCNAVLEALAAAGVEPKRMVLADGPPGGDGLSSRRLLIVLQGQDEAAPGESYSGEPAQGGMLDKLLNPTPRR